MVLAALIRNYKTQTTMITVLAQGSPCLGKADNTIGAEYAYGIAPGSTWPNPTVVARTGAWDVGAFVGTAGGPPPQPTPTPSPTPEPTPKVQDWRLRYPDQECQCA